MMHNFTQFRAKTFSDIINEGSVSDFVLIMLYLILELTNVTLFILHSALSMSYVLMFPATEPSSC